MREISTFSYASQSVQAMGEVFARIFLDELHDIEEQKNTKADFCLQELLKQWEHDFAKLSEYFSIKIDRSCIERNITMKRRKQ